MINKEEKVQEIQQVVNLRWWVFDLVIKHWLGHPHLVLDYLVLARFNSDCSNFQVLQNLRGSSDYSNSSTHIGGLDWDWTLLSFVM